jgi:hypothetical protein
MEDPGRVNAKHFVDDEREVARTAIMHKNFMIRFELKRRWAEK